MSAPVCPKCRQNMQEGFIADETYGARLQAQWAEGAPKPSFWTGLKIAKGTQHPITTFRCEGCGYLESYALE